jgi:ankyrin repeat protein
MSKKLVQSLVDKAVVVHKPKGDNIHTYTNKTASDIGCAELVELFISKGKDPSSISHRVNTSLMDMYKWIDREYHKDLY